MAGAQLAVFWDVVVGFFSRTCEKFPVGGEGKWAMETVCVVLSAETHPREGISSIRGTVVLAMNQETLPFPLPVQQRPECCRQHFHPERVFLVPLFVSLHPLEHPLQWAKCRWCPGVVFPLLFSFFQQTGVTGGAGLCTGAIRWLCCRNIGDVARSCVVPSVSAEVCGLDAFSQPCSKMMQQELCHGIGLGLVQINKCAPRAVQKLGC